MKSGKWAKICRATAGIALAAGLTLLTAGCKGYKIQIVPDTPNDQTQEDGNKEDLNNQGNQNNQGGSTAPTQPTTPTEPDYSQYSPLLQDVLKSDYYNDLISASNSGHLKEQIGAGDFDSDFNLFEPIPYRFLEGKGEDIKNIKLNNVRANAIQYVLDADKNTLFNKVDLTYQNDNGNIMKQYLIKYQISDQEYDDLKMLFEGHYYQADLMVQELDNQRDAELVNEFAIDEKTYKGLLKSVNNSKSINETFNGKYKEQIDSFIISSIKNYPDERYPNDYYLTFKLFTKGNNDNVSKRETFSGVGLHHGATLNNGNYTTLKNSILLSKITDITEPVPITWFNITTNTTKTKDFVKK